MKKIFTLCVLVCLAVVSCKKKDPEPTPKPQAIAVASVSLTPSELVLTVGDTQTLTVNVLPENADNKNYEFSLSKDGVVEIDDETGEVTALAAGSVIVTVTTADGGKIATSLVTVQEAAIPVSSVALNKSELSLIVGDDYQLLAIVSPVGAANKNVTWSSDDNTVASVDQAGLVSALKEGTAVITVTAEDGEKTASCTVNVAKALIPVQSVSLSLASWNPVVGEVLTLTATVLPEDATNKEVEWIVDDKSILSIDQNGNVTALAYGEANVTVRTVDGAKTALCNVFVAYKPSESITLSDPVDMEVGDRQTLVYTILPAEANQEEVIWSYEPYDGSVITMDEITGEITAVAAGTATVTIKTMDGKSASKTFIVKEPFAVSPKMEQAWAGQSIEIEANREIASMTFSVASHYVLDEDAGRGTYAEGNKVNLGLYLDTQNHYRTVDAIVTVNVKSVDGKTASCTVLSKGWTPVFCWNGDEGWSIDEIAGNSLFYIKFKSGNRYLSREEFESFVTLTPQREEAVYHLTTSDTADGWAYYFAPGYIDRGEYRAYHFLISCGTVRFDYDYQEPVFTDQDM